MKKRKMNLNIEIVDTGREIDIYLNNEDVISITYWDDCNRGNDSTLGITFKDLFHLIEDNKKAKSLSASLNLEREKNKNLTIENKSLESEISILKSAFKSIHGNE